MVIRCRGDWYWCERKNPNGTWTAMFVREPDHDEWDHTNQALFEDDEAEIVRLGGKPGDGYRPIGG